MVRRHVNIPIFVPHKGCPHNCAFCNQNKITGVREEMDCNAAQKIIEAHLATLADRQNTTVEIAFFGGSFTAVDEKLQAELCALASRYRARGDVDGIRCSTRPDCVDRAVLGRLKESGFTMVELGAQSSDDSVLRQCGRGHTFSDTAAASSLIRESGLSLGLQMMVGLPGDTELGAYKTARDLILLKPDCVRIYPTLVLPGTGLDTLYRCGKYIPMGLEQTVEVCATLLELFERAGIAVIRVGLQTTDEINERTVVGPYHPALRALAASRVFRRRLERQICAPGRFTVLANERDISLLLGEKRQNIAYLKARYGAEVTVRADASVLRGKFFIQRTGTNLL